MTIKFLRNFILFILYFGIGFQAAAQDICSGNLGENIFEDGDFGSGADIILQEDPLIALGYFYERNPPPFDGEYLITNNSGWENKYGTWLSIGDNSDDPFGYMMVVNADFTPGIFFEQIVDGLCENTSYAFSADIINMIMTGVANHSDPDVSFLLDDEVQFTTGNIPKSESWITYGFSFTAEAGQTEVKLTIRNNAPGGIGNDLALDNISFRACGPDADIISEGSKITLCPDSQPFTLLTNVETQDDQFVQWQLSENSGDDWFDISGETQPEFIHETFEPGQYSYRYLVATSTDNLQSSKCRIVSDTVVVEVLPIEFLVIDTICQGTEFKLGDNNIQVEGIYIDTLIGRRGCDSIVTLDLTVIPDQGLQIVTANTNPGCFGDENGRIQVTDVVNGTGLFTYIFNGDTTLFSEFNDLRSGLYNIDVFDRYKCEANLEITLSDPPIFEIEFGADQVVELGDISIVNLNFNKPISVYEWNLIPPDPDCPNCNTFSYIPLNSSNFILQATDEFGCTATDSILIQVDKTFNVYIPNSFSPNGDNNNDQFTVFAKNGLVESVESIQIFDRWGNQVFANENIMANDPNSGWDGTFNGNDPEPGAYAYKVGLRLIDQTVFQLSGIVTLIE